MRTDEHRKILQQLWESEELAMAIISFKCPNCGGELIFDPATQKYKCEYCNSLFTQEELDAMKPMQGGEPDAVAQEQAGGERADEPEAAAQERAAQAAAGAAAGEKAETGQTVGERESEPEGEAVYYSCPSCGAEIVTDATTAATFCYYCHNPVVLGKRLEGSYLPNKIIPFEIGREDAEKKFLDFVSKKKYVPKAFFNKKQIESMTGVYFPYWVYDVELEGKMQGDARSVRMWTTGNTQYTETKYYAVEREGNVSLRNLTENALKKANVKLTSGVMPYAYDKMKDFHMGYLSGFLAERRDIEQNAVQGKMQHTMRESAEKLMRDTISGYNSVSVKNTFFAPKKEIWSYVLLPVWTITYKGRDGKVYYYSMNGQNGNICGDLPVDRPRLALTSLLIALGILVFGLLGGYFLW